jgi:glycosyltransferase involved in cell wall biosynthesis
MNVCWVPYVFPIHSQARGYLNMAASYREALSSKCDLRQATRAANGWLVETEVGDPILHICPPHYFLPLHGHVNWLFSMWELDELPADELRFVKLAEKHIVPSSYCASVWRRHGLLPATVPLGIHHDFCNASLSKPVFSVDTPARFLWLGSTQERKGWRNLARAWELTFKTTEPVELLIKFIGDGSVEQYYDGRITVDQRDLSRDALIGIYESAHAFVFPTYGEGYGLPVVEAMAAGCLVVAPRNTGLADIVTEERAVVVEENGPIRIQMGGPWEARFRATDLDISKALRKALRLIQSGKADRITRHAAHWAREQTWDAAALALLDTMGRGH